MLSALRFIKFKLSHPESIDFVDQGLGIEARAKRCKKYWAKHLEFSKSFIKSSIEKSGDCRSAAILGAGRLYDVPLAAFSHFDLVALVDADPSCLKHWQRAANHCPGPEYDYIVDDVTGSIENWSAQLADKLKINKGDRSSDYVVSLLKTLAINSNQGIDKSYDLIVSINLLSQIPIYWRDRVAHLLLKHIKLDSDQNGNYSQALNSALSETYRKLQADHLRRLSSLANQTMVIISDQYFHYYQKDKSPWQSETALYVDGFSASKDWTLESQESWFWHIAPQDIEQSQFGVIHEVQASCYRRS